jgi:ribosomal protein S18 acetylase RimI-like enzyme
LNALIQVQTAGLVDKLGNPFHVRELEGRDDRIRLHRMYAAFVPKRAAQGLPPETDHGIQRWLDRVLAHGRHLGIEINGSLCGHGMLVPMDDPKETELANFLHQSIRGRGIGTALNRLLVTRALEAGYNRVWLSVEPSNIAAIRSYTNAGFKTLRNSLWAPEIEMEVVLNHGNGTTDV